MPNATTPTHRCPACKRDLPLTAYYPCRSKPSGVQTYCRECSRPKDRENRRRYHARHRERRVAESAKYRSEHPDYMLALGRRYREANRERSREQSHRSRLKHLETRLEAERLYREQNAAACRERCNRWRRANPEKWCQVQARREARKRGTQIGPVDYAAILARDGLTCHICGGPVTRETLEFDHVVPLARGGPHTAANIRVSHNRCNWKKGARLLP